MGGRRNLSRWLLYCMCLAAALGTLGYYWLEYIPGKREYFLNLRFRALATIAAQFQSKVDGLVQSLYNADRPGAAKPATTYISAMVPDLACGLTSTRPASKRPIDIDAVSFDPAGECAPTAKISKILPASVNDALFDDLLIADSSGRVVYQRAASSPRILGLEGLLKRPADTKIVVAEGGGMDADAVRTVQLDGSSYAMLLQPLRFSLHADPAAGTETLVMIGLTRSERLAAEARHVPPKYLLLIFAPLIVVLLSGPFLKILLLTRTCRLVFRDMVLLSLFTLIAAGMATILLFSWYEYDLAFDKMQPRMADFANSLETGIAWDLRVMRQTLESFDGALPPDLSTTPELKRDRVDIPPESFLPAGAAFLPLDIAFWTNAKGCQVAKWTTRRMNTSRVDQTDKEHFRKVVERTLMKLTGPDDLPDMPFSLETLVSPTTSELIVVMAMRTAHSTVKVSGCGAKEASELVSAAIISPIPSLDSPVVPPGAGFAIFEPGGNVIFHSIPERSLHENLFEEMSQPEPWRAAVAMRAERSGSAYYRGRKYQFRVRPFRLLAGSSWNIAVFREMEPDQAMIGLVWAETLICFFAMLCAVIAGFALASAIARALGLKWGDQADYVLSRVWPHPQRRSLYRSIAAHLAAISVVGLALLMLGAGDVLQWAGWLLPIYLITPVLAILMITFRLWKAVEVSWSGAIVDNIQRPYIVCLALCVLVLAIIPTTGIFRVCHAFETRLHLLRWQQDLANQIEDRQTQRTAAFESSPALGPDLKKYLRTHPEALQGPQNRWARPAYLRAFWDTQINPDDVYAAAWNPAWWETLLSTLRPEAQTDAVESGILARSPQSAAACRAFTGPRMSFVLRCSGTVNISSTLTDAGVPASLLWWFVSLTLLGCAYAWYALALRRLFVLDLRYIPLPALTTVNAAETEGHVLVLGLPLAKKDRAVRDWLKLKPPPPRVNLYEAHFHQYWVQETMARVESELRAPAVRAATVGGAPVNMAARVPWVHISNLEARLREPNERRVVTDLIERLCTMNVSEAPVRVVVTSTIDPVFHFDSVVYQHLKEVLENPLSEHEEQRIARILHNFRKAQVSSPDKPVWAGSGYGPVLYEECRSHEALLAIGEEVNKAANNLPAGLVLPTLAERAQALYKLFWASCTRSEKLLLIQLAQTGFVNPLCIDTLEDLMRKGLILPEPQPRIMNRTFRQFLIAVESPETVRQWEHEAGESSWPVIRNIALVLVVVGVGVIASTQSQAMQTLTAVVTGVGTVLAGIFRLIGFLGTRRTPAPDVPTGS